MLKMNFIFMLLLVRMILKRSWKNHNLMVPYRGLLPEGFPAWYPHSELAQISL